MALERVFGKERMCKGKRKYYDKEYVDKILAKAKNAGVAVTRAYRCPICTYYHLTSQPEKAGVV